MSEALRLRDSASISHDVRRAEKLRVWLTERWDEEFISITAIVQAGAASIRTAKDARALIPLLSANGWLVQEEGGAVVKGKLRKEAWRIIGGHY